MAEIGKINVPVSVTYEQTYTEADLAKAYARGRAGAAPPPVGSEGLREALERLLWAMDEHGLDSIPGGVALARANARLALAAPAPALDVDVDE